MEIWRMVKAIPLPLLRARGFLRTLAAPRPRSPRTRSRLPACPLRPARPTPRPRPALAGWVVPAPQRVRRHGWPGYRAAAEAVRAARPFARCDLAWIPARTRARPPSTQQPEPAPRPGGA